MMATISPFRMSRSSPRSAWTSTPPLSYVLTSRRAITIRSSLRGAGARFAGAAAVGWTVIASDTKGAGSEGRRCEAPAVLQDFGGFLGGQGAEGHGQPHDGPQA